MAMGWDTALILGGASIAGSALAANMTNQANAAQNAFSAEQADSFFRQSRDTNNMQAQMTRDWNAQEAAVTRGYNSEEAAKARGWSAEQAALAREYETNMSNTAMQRKVQDLQLAGLNPMLAYTQGGASTPNASSPGASSASAGIAQGAQAQGVSGQVPNKIAMSPVLNSSAFSVRDAMEMGRQEAVIDNIKADTMQKAGMTPPTMAQAQLLERQAQDIVKKWDKIKPEIENLQASTWKDQMQAEVNAAVQGLTIAQTGVAKGTVSLQEAQRALVNVQTVAQKYGLDELKASSDLWKKLGSADTAGGDAGELMKFLQKAAPIIRMLLK